MLSPVRELLKIGFKTLILGRCICSDSRDVVYWILRVNSNYEKGSRISSMQQFEGESKELEKEYNLQNIAYHG